ncbi:MAG TPA: hypothetical protein DDW76_35045 [Cyanobacteria bacterium UBA11369]|nr:hypothetical protein [Cyanobacteria bacterium UBA11371]HBE29912.1 hypothetical protein [Cyanobacteria bacterium UBA11368]HBE53828.1 hypothetical protein [Cyanobacteria bacterium UBA11369]
MGDSLFHYYRSLYKQGVNYLRLKLSQQTEERKNIKRLGATSLYQIVKLFDLLLENNKANLKLVSGCRKQEMLKSIFYKS